MRRCFFSESFCSRACRQTQETDLERFVVSRPRDLPQKKRDPIPQKRFFPADAGRYGVHVHGVIIVMLGEANERISLLERVV